VERWIGHPEERASRTQNVLEPDEEPGSQEAAERITERRLWAADRPGDFVE
jgi:hypothetical protein